MTMLFGRTVRPGKAHVQRSTTLHLAVPLFAVAALAACGESADDAAPSSASTSTSSTVAAAVAPEATDVAPAPAATTEETATPATTTPATTAPGTTAPLPGTADCLQGTWVMDDATTGAFYAALLPGFPLVVVGSHQVGFDGDAIEYYINEILDFSPTGANIQVPYDQRSAGSFTLAASASGGEDIVIVYTTVEGGFSNAGGSVEDSEGNPIAVDVPIPGFELPPLAGGPVACDDDILTITFTSGLATAVATYSKIADGT